MLESIRCMQCKLLQIPASAKCMNVTCRWKCYLVHLQFNPVCDLCTLHLCMHGYSMCVGVCLQVSARVHVVLPVIISLLSPTQTELLTADTPAGLCESYSPGLGESYCALNDFALLKKKSFKGGDIEKKTLSRCIIEARISLIVCDH